MKVRFFYYETVSSNLLHNSLWIGAQTETQETGGYDRCVLSSLGTDFSENLYGHVDLVLRAVDKVGGGALAEFEWEGQGFTAHITRDRVRFEHSVFGECPEWPIWCCTLAQYKAALQGYLQFLDMPKSIDSELIIELPEGEARCD